MESVAQIRYLDQLLPLVADSAVSKQPVLVVVGAVADLLLAYIKVPAVPELWVKVIPVVQVRRVVRQEQRVLVAVQVLQVAMVRLNVHLPMVE